MKYLKKIWLWILVSVFGLGIALAAMPEKPLDTSKEELQNKYNQSEIKNKYELDGVSLVRNKIINSELDKYKNEPKDEIEVRIGNKVDPELLGATNVNFEPTIELERWNEVSFKIIPDISDVALKDRKLSFDNEKILFETPKMSFEMYEYTEGEGGYKFIWYLNEKPASNVIEFKIESEGLDFFYQPIYTEEEIIQKETEGFFVNRNIMGSYAVYHQIKGGMNDIYGKDYKVGKAFHIYRPHIIDADGKETWGILHIENGIYSVEIPQDFLDEAVYPIKSNDTFGYEDIGDSEGWTGADYLKGYRFTSPANINTIESISFYNKYTNTPDIKGIIVLHSNLNIINNGIGTGTTICGDECWTTSEFGTNPSVTPNIDYLLSIVVSANYIKIAYDTGINNYYYEDENNYESPVNPTEASQGNIVFSIYATYTPAGGEEEAPAPQYQDIIWF